VIVTVVGVAAALFSIASFVPQAWKIWRTRETKGLSTKMWIFNTTAFALWTTYGVFLSKWPIIVTNAICLLLAAFILSMKVRARRTASR
jgi:MtN3 and saliva related transmembrane protein